MDMIQEMMLLMTELIRKLREIFFFVNSQFLPESDIDEKDKDHHDKHK